MNILDRLHLVPGIYPVANFAAGTTNSVCVRCLSAVGVRFTYIKGVGAAGTATLTVEACPDATPSLQTPVPFQYRESTTPDTWGAWIQATATGFPTTAGSNQVYELFVPAAHLAALGYEYVRLHSVELNAAAVVGCVMIEVVQPRYQTVPISLLV